MIPTTITHKSIFQLCIILIFCTMTLTLGQELSTEINQPQILVDKQSVSEQNTPTMDIASKWMQLVYKRVDGEGLVPPTAARLYAYAGLTLYVVMQQGVSHTSLSKGNVDDKLEHLYLHTIFKELPSLAEPDTELEYDWLTVTNTAVANVIDELMALSSDSALKFAASRQGTERQIAALQREIQQQRQGQIEVDVLIRSITHGETLAKSIIDWANNDGYLDFRDMHYISLTASPDLWEPKAIGRDPIDPYWGELRPFSQSIIDCYIAPPETLQFSDEVGSSFYNAAMEVYEQSFTLDKNQRTLAMFWDDMPADTGTHAGHWMMIAIQLAEDFELKLVDKAELYTLLGVAMHDSFISAWSAKYHDMVLRPDTYINRYIDMSWKPLLDTPNFPEYPSGHSVVGGAASEVLTSFFGSQSFKDNYGLVDDMWTSYDFSSFKDAALTNALSRFYGGVHYKVSVINGLTQGECVGEKVLQKAKTNNTHILQVSDINVVSFEGLETSQNTNH